MPLWAHQIQEVELFCRNKGRAGFLADPGTGKTCATYHCILRLAAHLGRTPKTIIIGPKSVGYQYVADAERHTPALAGQMEVLTGGNREKKLLQILKDKNRSILIVNHDAVRAKNFWALLQKFGAELVVVDESHKIKTPNSSRSKAIRALAAAARWRLILTGTFVTNSFEDIWAQMVAIDPAIFDRNFYVWRAQYGYDKNAGMPKIVHFPDWQVRPDKVAELNEIIGRWCIRVKKEDAIDLPAFVRQEIPIQMTADQADHYYSLEEDFYTSLGSLEIVTDVAVVKLLRLLQVCNGILSDGHQTKLIATAKDEALADILDGLPSGAKCIVWANFVPCHSRIAMVCETLGLKTARIVGGMSAKAVQENIDAFKRDPAVRVLYANQSAGGVGLNLQEASYAVYYSKGYSLEEDIQSEARFYRGGSVDLHSKVTRIDLTTIGTVEMAVNESLANKKTLAELFLELRKHAKKAA